jgi:hypothetical protein
MGAKDEDQTLKQRLGRVSENKTETEDDGSDRNKRSERVGAVKDEETDEQDNDQSERDQDTVQFAHSTEKPS